MDWAYEVYFRGFNLAIAIDSREILVWSSLKIWFSLKNPHFTEFRLHSTKIFIVCSIPIFVMHRGNPNLCSLQFEISLSLRPQRTSPSDVYSFVPDAKQLEDTVSRLMFLCILRLSTHKESSVCFLLEFWPKKEPNSNFSRKISSHPKVSAS